MSGAPVTGFLPSAAWQFEGENKESDRRRKTRAENRKNLQEWADAQAANGRPLTVDEWGQQVNDIVGADGYLNGYAPTNQMIEGMRQNQIAKAEQVAKANKQKDFENARSNDEKMQKHIDDLVRSETDDTKIGGLLVEQFGDEGKRMLPKVAAARARMSQTDTADGLKLGSTMETVAEAEEYGSLNPNMSKTHLAAVRQSAQKNEEKALRQISYEINPRGITPENEPQIREFIRSMLPEAMQKKEPDKYVDRALQIIRARNATGAVADARGIDLAAGTAMANKAPEIVMTGAQLEMKDADRRAELQQNIGKSFDINEKARKDGMRMQHKGLLESKDKKIAGAADVAITFLSEVDAFNANEIMAAAASGDSNAVQAAIEKARKFGSAPHAKKLESIKIATEMSQGFGFSDNSSLDYKKIFARGTGEDDVKLTQGLAKEAAAYRAKGDTNRADDMTSTISTTLIKRVLENRQILGQSGKFSASAETLSELEKAEVSSFLQRANLPPDVFTKVWKEVLGSIGGAEAISRRATSTERYQETMRQAGTPWLYGGGRTPYSGGGGGGGGGGYPSATQVPATTGGPVSNRWWQ